MHRTIDTTVDTFDDRASNRAPIEEDGPTRDEQEEIVRPTTAPRHVIREDAPVIDEDDPAPLRESDAVLPPMDATMPDASAAEERWKVDLRDAARRWDRLTEDDILALGRHIASLSALVRKRYALSIEETERQVTDFIKDHQSTAL